MCKDHVSSTDLFMWIFGGWALSLIILFICIGIWRLLI
jgi:hypothetical protein